MNHKEYINILSEKKQIRHKTKRIQSKPHRIGTYNNNKISLSCFDDKRYIIGDRTKTLACGQKFVKFLFS